MGGSIDYHLYCRSGNNCRSLSLSLSLSLCVWKGTLVLMGTQDLYLVCYECGWVDRWYICIILSSRECLWVAEREREVIIVSSHTRGIKHTHRETFNDGWVWMTNGHLKHGLGKFRPLFLLSLCSTAETWRVSNCATGDRWRKPWHLNRQDQSSRKHN